MMRFSAPEFCNAFFDLVAIHTKLGIKESSYLSLEETTKINFMLTKLSKTCAAIGLKVCAAMADYYRDEKIYPIKETRQALAATQSMVVAMSREIDTEIFFKLPSETVEMFSEQPKAIFGTEADDAFPSAREDVQEAANCFCLERWQATVFHLMRVLERGLFVLGRKFGVPTAQSNWHNSIEQIESKIRSIDRTWGSDWKDQQKTYSNIARHFMFLKDAWRNHVMHVSDIYDKGKAESAFQHTREFMQELAKHLKEAPPAQP